MLTKLVHYAIRNLEVNNKDEEWSSDTKKNLQIRI